MMDDIKNIAARIDEKALQFPEKKAVIATSKKGGHDFLTFFELVAESKNYAAHLKELGLRPGHKVLVFVRPGIEFPVITFALFRMGVIPVFIDPGMGKENLLRSIKELKPEGLIAVPEVHFLRLFYPSIFNSIKFFVTTGKLTWGKMVSTKTWQKKKKDFNDKVSITADQMAAILFTSGGTGIPKGVVYTHRIFNTQTDMLKELFSLNETEVDIPGFPLFAFFTMAMGMTSCIPDMNPSRPAKADPKILVKNIQDHKGTFVAGSPAIWERVARYCVKNNITLPTVKYLVMFGAPVSPLIHEMFQKVLPNGTTYTPYGATECLPVANVEGRFLLEKTVKKTKQGAGTCVGKVAPGIQLKIIAITDDVIPTMSEATELPILSMGEILVTGDVVTKEYFNMPEKTAEAKIYDNGTVWHRMGDIGYVDEEGHLWFCGRKSYRVHAKSGLKSSIQCEAIFNEHPQIKRTALIGLGQKSEKELGLVVERFDKKILKGAEREKFIEELKLLARSFEHTKDIKHFYQSNAFPVDVRHNIKIDRIKLAQLANEGKLQ